MPHFNAQRGKWMAQVVVNGCKLRRQFDTKAEARRWEIEKKDALERPARPPGLLFTLGSWSEAYLVFAQGKFSYKTVSEKRLAFRLLFMSVPSATPAADLRKGDALAHFAAQARARSGNAANKDRKNLVAAWNWAAEYLPDFPARNPFLTELFPEERSARQVPTENEFWAVHAAAESEQDRAMLLCFLHLAARRNEIFRLRLEDVDLDRQRVRLHTRKRKDGSQHHDWLPMSDRLRKAMAGHLSLCSGEWVFPNPQTGLPYFERSKWLPKLCRLAGVKEFGLHGIRHLSASILIRAKVSLLDVQTILRHTNLTTTQRYVHRLESVRKAIEVFE
ncbi:MAG: tyrosine-type recombinase/integrase [Candidatus Electronema sp. V4]|uniref:tyrosine-type recombinase/integrase n=2 Tax=Candidatus Electronema sp. V4 TaxID=3454756 RepID=UPI0040556301